jgi:hypothetical protein
MLSKNYKHGEEYGRKPILITNQDIEIRKGYYIQTTV